MGRVKSHGDRNGKPGQPHRSCPEPKPVLVKVPTPHRDYIIRPSPRQGEICNGGGARSIAARRSADGATKST